MQQAVSSNTGQNIADNKKLIPASAVMAGVYCATDAQPWRLESTGECRAQRN